MDAARSGSQSSTKFSGKCGPGRNQMSLFIFAQFEGTEFRPGRNLVCFRAGGAARWGVPVQELPVVLVIEDDPDVQIILEDALTEGGFEPAIAASGEEAVTLLRSGLMKYRALVTDVVLKGRMDGWEVARQSREIDPAFPVVYITGSAVRRWPSRGVPNSILLEKPFAPAQLVTAVSQLLNAGTFPGGPVS
jgi:CheY-like chemotaxis protein